MNLSRSLISAAALGAVIALTPGVSLAQSAYDRLVAASKAEMERTGGKVRIALDWTASDARPVLPEFTKDFPHVKEMAFTRETGTAPFARFLLGIRQNQFPPYDIMHVASEFQQQYLAAGAFAKPMFGYTELNNSLPGDWPKIHPAALDNDGMFLATTGNIRGNAWNVTMVPRGQEPRTWANCVEPKYKANSIYDARNKTQAFQYDEKERARHTAWLKQLAANQTVFTRGQAQVLQRVVAGEFPISCFVNYHTVQRMIEVDKVTLLGFSLAESIPLEIGTRLYIPKWSATPATAQLFTLWAATRGQVHIDKHAYRGFPWIPGTRLFEQAKGKHIALCGADCAEKFETYNQEHADLLGIPYVREDD